ncbi:tRNA (adenine-N(1))-methyltransferase [Aerococcus agrisoli]|uniref:tRNA (Adenine-N(1))-methyltransferase n=1 Tax=Aerococcus agrisoli TaxID=2487350 RepID=A0A3N4GVW4_9LACT|nr:tRNA (adenine(22)-N(1))-methyltransferase TrmK [Aerococcus agrisoli]RPA65028.1 tRNA (adenine-N(1))-methyltransferase [Aerococcus agrisoli]
MNVNHLSDRLAAVASFVQEDARLADIGSDHAYLPTHLASTGKITFAIAGEVVDGPFQAAKQEIERQDLSHMIEARLGNGLAVVEAEDQIDTVTICGMGGALIVEILTAGHADDKLATHPRLILQANVAEEKVREWLNRNAYAIVDETIIEENEKFYEIIVADYTEETLEPWSQEDLMFGRFIKTKEPAVFARKWQAALDRTNYVLGQLEKAQNPDQAKIDAHQALKQAIEAQLA